MAPRSTPALAAAIALFALTGAARAQNALGGGRALDGGLANLPGGRVNPSATDYQSILRYNTNAGNALNGPGIDINALNARGSLATSFNRPFLLAPFAGGPAGGRLTGFNNADPLGATIGSPIGAASGGFTGLRSPDTNRIAALEAGYLPNGALTSSITLPQGTTADDYRRGAEPLVGFIFDNRGNAIPARASSLRGLTLSPITAPTPIVAPGDTARIGSTAVYNRVIDELRRAATGRPSGAVAGTRGAPTPADPAVPPSGTPTPPSTPERASTPVNPAGGEKPNANPVPQPDAGGTPYDAPSALKRLRDRLSPPPPGRRAPNLTPDPSNGAATLSLTEDDIKALREMGIKLDTLVPAGATDAQATDAYTRLGQEALGGGRYGLADQLFQSALGRSPRNTMAQAGRINAVMGLGLLMTAGNDLRDFYTDHPEMIPVRFESTLLMPRARADHLAGLLTADIDKGADGTIANSGLTLAFLGRQFENQAWLDKGLDAMAAQTTGDPQGAELWKVLNAVWRANAKPSPPAEPTK